MDNKFIKCKDVFFRYDSEENSNLVLNGVSIDIIEGEFLAILGHNGSGKSTIAKHMNALLIPTEGKVEVEELNTSLKENMWDVRKKVGMVFQNPDNQLVATIVEEDVAFGPENLGIPSDEIRKRVDEALKIVDMYEYKRHAPHMLSGGQKQRVAIAGVLAMKTKCIVLDEPTAMLDPNGRREVISTLKYLNKNFGITIVLITHFMDETTDADRIIVMDQGNVVMQGEPREIFSNVATMKSLGLDVPHMTELAYRLSKSGVKIRTDILTLDEMVNEICRLKSKI